LGCPFLVAFLGESQDEIPRRLGANLLDLKPSSLLTKTDEVLNEDLIFVLTASSRPSEKVSDPQGDQSVCLVFGESEKFVDEGIVQVHTCIGTLH
jgi:hypothetical protein